MVKTKKKVSKIKIKKKIWFPILAPRVFGKKIIGETYLPTVDKAVGRVMKVNLRELTGDMKNQNVQVSFKINKIEGGTLQTTTIGYNLTSAYIKRIIRKNSARLDDCFVLDTKLGDKVIVKCLMITLYRTQRSTKTELRKQLEKLLKEEVSKIDFPTFIGNVIYKRMTLDLKKNLSKVFPLKEVAFRTIILKQKGKVETVKEIKSVKEIKPEPVVAAKTEEELVVAKS